MIKRLIKKSLRSSIFRRSVAAATVRTTGKFISLVLRIAAIKILGDFIIGVYSISKEILDSVFSFSTLGMDVYLMRHISTNPSKQKLQKLYSYVTGLLLASGVIITLIFELSAPFIASQILHKPMLATPLRIIMVGITPWIFLTLFIRGLRGKGLIVASTTFDSAVIPTFSLISLTLLELLHLPKPSYVYNIISVISAWLTTIIAGVYFQHNASVKFKPSLNPKYRPNDLLSFGGGIYLLRIVSNISNFLYSSIKARLAGIVELGVLVSLQRILGVLGIPANAVVNTTIPHLVESLETKDRARLRKLRYKSILLSLGMMVPLAAGLIIIKSPLLSKIGPLYVKFAYIVDLQVINGIVNVFQNVFVTTLEMAKKQKALIIFTAAVRTPLTLLLAILLIPKFGVAGIVYTDILVALISSVYYLLLIELQYKI